MDGDNVKHFRENNIFLDARPENPTIKRRRRDISSLTAALIIIPAEHASASGFFFCLNAYVGNSDNVIIIIIFGRTYVSSNTV